MAKTTRAHTLSPAILIYNLLNNIALHPYRTYTVRHIPSATQ